MPRRKKDKQRLELMGGAALVVCLLLSIGVFGAAGVQRYALRSPELAAVVSAILVDLANGDRAEQGLSTLTVNPVLVAAAQAKANDMATYGYFAHVSPTGVDPWHWFKQAGYAFDYAGENLAVDFSDSGDVNRAWMQSPTHRANILDPHYTEIGIATAQGIYQGRPTTFVVQEFGHPTPEKQAPVAASRVPERPTEVATATTHETTAEVSTGSAASVLGSSASQRAAAPLVIEPEKAAALARDTGAVPLWGYILGFPREAMHIAFYILAGLILAGLILDTGFEMRAHHARKAKHAAIALGVVCICFVVADYLFFAPPVLALIAASL